MLMLTLRPVAQGYDKNRSMVIKENQLLFNSEMKRATQETYTW